jgi:predicted transposase YbfD/YdcC
VGSEGVAEQGVAEQGVAEQGVAEQGVAEQAEPEELDEEKVRAELSVAPLVLRQVALRGRVVTGDALYCQRTLCQQIHHAHGHYLFVIKANQPELLAEVALLFDAPPPGERFATAVSRRARRDRCEARTLTSSVALARYVQALGWVGAQQVLRLQSVVTRKDKTTQMVRYFITSLGPQTAPRSLLRFVREHWHIENRLHYVRDVTLGEDASQVRSGSAPQVLAALRNALLGLLRQHGWSNIAEALRHFAWTPGAAMHLLGLHPT